ncbi:MAG TPA: hypothetical protein VN253_24650 [Kofleriaceae bacterium]|nr:hypothetical protein [Kofleriaceae bacterium]
MVLARTAPSVALLVILAGCASGAAARGCATGCRSGSRVARSSHALEDLARTIPRTQPARVGIKPLVVPGRIGGEIGGQVGERIAVAGLEDAVAALPPVEGSVSSLTKVPSSSGSTMVTRTGARSFADDYARSIDSLHVTRHQHEQLLDAFDIAQSVLDVASPDDGDDASDGEAMRELAERRRIERTAEVMARRIPQVLDGEQARRLYAALGTPQVIAYRLARERPMTPAPSAGSAPR